MQKPRNSECFFTKPIPYVSAALALMTLVLSCPLSAQDAGNTQTAKQAVAKKMPIKSADVGNVQAKPKAGDESSVPEQKNADAQKNAGSPKDGDGKKDAYATDLSTVTQITMEQSIESARQRKLRDLAEAVRAQLEGKAAATTPAPALNNISLPTEKLPETVVVDTTPRLWSLTANGQRVWAEVWFNGQIVQLDSFNGQLVQLEADKHVPELGPWKVLSLTDDGLVLGRTIEAVAEKGKQVKKQERMLLRAPARGISAVNYQFPPAGSAAVGVLPGSAQRAAQLPLGTGVQR